MASKRALRRRGCKGKIRHESFEAAAAACRSFQRATGHLLHAYRCEFCRGFHAGHNPNQMRNRFHIFSGKRRGT